MAPHVTNVDYLSRKIDPVTGNLHTERLLSCKQNVPEFLLKLIGSGGQGTSIVYERSVVDLKNRRLVLKSTNLTYSHLMVVEETCIYEPSFAEVKDNENISRFDWTKFTQSASIRSFSAWNYIRESMEDFSINRFQANASKGRAALENVLHGLIDDTKSLLEEKFGEFSDEVQLFIKAREDPRVQDEATHIAEEAIIEQE